VKYYTHLLAGVLLYFLLLYFKIIEPNITLLMTIALGSLLPDIDHPNSYINNQLRVTKPIGRTIRHRGFTHSIEFIILVSILLKIIGVNTTIIFGLLIGIISHLIMDSITVSGVRWSYFLGKPHIKGPIRTGGTGENIIFVIMIFILVGILYKSI